MFFTLHNENPIPWFASQVTQLPRRLLTSDLSSSRRKGSLERDCSKATGCWRQPSSRGWSSTGKKTSFRCQTRLEEALPKARLKFDPCWRRFSCSLTKHFIPKDLLKTWPKCWSGSSFQISGSGSDLFQIFRFCFGQVERTARLGLCIV